MTERSLISIKPTFSNMSEIVSHRCKTHTVSNAAFRGFGGPQGMRSIERILDDIARTLGLDPLDVRRANFYGVRIEM